MPPRPSGSSSRSEPKVRPARLRIVMRRFVSWLPRPSPRRGFATLERVVRAAGTRYGAGEANGFSTSGKYVTATPHNATRDGRWLKPRLGAAATKPAAAGWDQIVPSPRRGTLRRAWRAPGAG